MSLFRVWYDDSNDRTEIARFKADDFVDVQDYLLKHFIKEGKQEEIEETDFGLMWNEFTPDECLEQHKADEIEGAEDEDYNPCDMCGGCSAGFSIEGVEEPTEDEFAFKTMRGTNDYYDLTKRKELEKKLEQLKAQYYRLSEQLSKDIDFVGPAAPTRAINQCNNEILTIEQWLREGIEKAPDWDKTLSGAWKKSPEHGVAALLLSSATPQEALSPELREKSKKLMKELE